MKGESLQPINVSSANALRKLVSALESECQLLAQSTSETTGPRHISDGLKHIREKLQAAIKGIEQKAHRDYIQQILVYEAGGRCERCRKTYNPALYDFHHRDPKQKEFNLDKSNFTRSIAKLRAEASKCVLLCCLCHREVHLYLDRRFLEV